MRFNLSQDPAEFAKHEVVKQMLADEGVECLPLVIVDDRVVSRSEYPSRENLAMWTGTTIKPKPRCRWPIPADAVAVIPAAANVRTQCSVHTENDDAIPKTPTRNLFFTGKGGVGKTSMACATAVQLADRGLRVLLVSTDPASNLDEVLGRDIGERTDGD